MGAKAQGGGDDDWKLATGEWAGLAAHLLALDPATYDRATRALYKIVEAVEARVAFRRGVAAMTPDGEIATGEFKSPSPTNVHSLFGTHES